MINDKIDNYTSEQTEQTQTDEKFGEAFCDKCSMDMEFDYHGNCIVCGTKICEDEE